MSDIFDDSPENFAMELAPNKELAGFLFDQFQDSVIRRVRSMGRTATGLGSPIGHLPDMGGASIVEGTESMVMKPPHPYDSRGNYAKVYAYVSPTPTELVLDYAGRDIYLTGTYRVQLTNPNPEEDEAWLVDENGSYAMDKDASMAEIDAGTAELRAILNSKHVLDVIGSYSSVFVVAEQPPQTA